MFPGCTPQMALQVAERLQQQIQRLRFTHEGRTFGITVSQGLTSLSAADENVENLFSRADTAMYQAKREGKNRIVTA
ncbi:Response regulator PleD [compost metagenome]